MCARVVIVVCMCTRVGVRITSGTIALLKSKPRLMARLVALTRMALAAARVAAMEQAWIVWLVWVLVT